MYDLDPETDYYAIAKQDYTRGWVSYLTAVWQMLRERIEADAAARLKARQQQPKPEVPKHLEDFFRATERLSQQTYPGKSPGREKPASKANPT